MGTPHERTKLGRELLDMRSRVEEWTILNRDRMSETEIKAAVWLAWDLYVAACNGLAVGSSGRSIGKVGLERAEKIATLLKSVRAQATKI